MNTISRQPGAVIVENDQLAWEIEAENNGELWHKEAIGKKAMRQRGNEATR
jgi:hypothetical protein